jgi:hypothetical protein
MPTNDPPRRSQQQSAELGELQLLDECGGTHDELLHDRFEYQ